MSGPLSLDEVRPSSPDQRHLFEKAQELEAAFLSEMLMHAGLSESPDGFGGGIGEDQFASYLRAEQARGIVAQGGIGLAQAIFESLVQAEQAKHEN